jgi:pimeloyl-ACP methyl ester carboxylesterase
MKQLLSVVIGTLLCATAQAQVMSLQVHNFVADDGSKVAAELGTLSTPERHRNPEGKRIVLKFVRFKSTSATPGLPIVYLAGGPGGSGIAAARGERFPLFMKLREVADVIALDQRGAGDSGTLPECVPAASYPLEQPLVLAGYVSYARKIAAQCATFWRDKGVDLNAYTSRESAADLALLRTALGVPKLNLWGISYGTHLALATAKYHPDAVSRLVLASSEGLGQIVKLPAQIDLMLGRLNEAIGSDEKTRARYPDLLASMARVHSRLEQKPVKVELKHPKTGQVQVIGIGPLDIQLLASYMIKNPREASMLPAMYAAMDAEQFAPIAPHVARMRGLLLRWQAMPLAMDAASGVGAARWRQIQAEASSSLLGRASDLPLPDINAELVDDLGDEYRRELNSDVPALFIAGTLDGRTTLESQLALAQGMRNAQTLVVKNAGHDLLVVSPDIGDAIVRFLRAEQQKVTQIVVAPPTFM